MESYRRAPTAAPPSRGRLPRGSTRRSDRLPPSHIQIVPRDNTEFSQDGDYLEDDDIPTFNSPSLQFSVSRSGQPKGSSDAAEKLPAKTATFADMARRFHTADNKAGVELSTYGSATSTGIIKLQPNRNKGDKLWWSLQATDAGESERASTGDSDNIDRLHHSANQVDEKLPRNTTTATRSSRSSPLDLLQRTTISNHTSLFRRGADTILDKSRGTSSADSSQSTPNEHYGQLFGRLPDPIHLQEQMGEFDGQIVFIGHPNRDVSAHQWSSSSFQWENIGRYAHTRGKIEGSLASDRIQVADALNDSLQYFELAAEAREKQIIEHGRPKEYNVGGSGAPADTDETGSLYNSSEQANQGSVAGVHSGDPTNFSSSRAKSSTPSEFPTPLKGAHLEDPFVVPTVSSKREASSSFHSGTGLNTTGSLDFGYQFPRKSNNTFLEKICDSDHIWREVERMKSAYTDSNNASTPNLREVGFGEEAACGFPSKAGHSGVAMKTPVYSSLEDYQNRQKLRSKLVEFGEQATQSHATAQRRITIPTLASMRPSARSLFPPPGLTVANPHRVPSNLNATAPPYVSKPAISPASEVSVPEVAIRKIVASAGLRSSDSDLLCRTQDYEIVNGLSQQAPTKQTFTGPFFTDSKPSTHDPTATLSVQIDEEEKLTTWFRDGQRPTRQREYANTLVSSAAASNRNRDFGAIGERTNKAKQHAYENTGLFVRLYESMSEYAEESRSGNNRAYFTRVWRPASRQQRASGPHDDNSYFDQNTAPSQARRRTYLEPNERSWGGLGLTANLTRARFPHGTPIGASRGERCRGNIF